MEVLFASLQHHCFWCFFWSRGPKLCPNRTGNTKFYKNLTRVRAYTRFPLSHVCPGTSRNKGNFSKKNYSTISTDRLEQNSEDVGVFHTSTYTMDVWKTPKIESCYTIFGCGNGAILVILFKKMDFFSSKKPKKMQKNKKNMFFVDKVHCPPNLRNNYIKDISLRRRVLALGASAPQNPPTPAIYRRVLAPVGKTNEATK